MKITWVNRRDRYFLELKVGEIFIPASDIVAFEQKRLLVKIDAEHAFCFTDNKIMTPGQNCTAFIVNAELVVQEDQ